MVAAMTGLEWPSPGGLIQMKLADGHQAIQPIAFSRTKIQSGSQAGRSGRYPVLRRRMRQPAPGVKAIDWIKGGMQGAKCN